METWHTILAVVLPLLTLLIIIGILLFRRHRRKSLQPKPPNNNPGRQTSKPTIPTRLPHHDKNNPPKDFRWADHPRLVTEAVEYGWLGFSFGSLLSSLPRSATTSASLWDFCAACDAARREHRAAYDTSWEVPPGSAEYMQRLRLHASSEAADPGCHGGCIRMSLPLPGPPLRQNSFPQEAYFEITIVAQRGASSISSTKAGPPPQSRGGRRSPPPPMKGTTLSLYERIRSPVVVAGIAARWSHWGSQEGTRRPVRSPGATSAPSASIQMGLFYLMG
ncbi:hypothetical protein QJS10_CPB13g00377 [Acorus calamus]|uniref:Uncharacterized protein n=1 Tax=Acorus calamus TaxID=4465 RepID=A0AAV9DIY0_ACOCL|nr:hypothetical protein QJS10_CPB13g00377 [Acorus calamus]